MYERKRNWVADDKDEQKDGDQKAAAAKESANPEDENQI